MRIHLRYYLFYFIIIPCEFHGGKDVGEVKAIRVEELPVWTCSGNKACAAVNSHPGS